MLRDGRATVPPPQPTEPTEATISRRATRKVMRRRVLVTQSISRPAIAVVPPRPQGSKPDGRARAVVVVEVVCTVRIEAAVAFAAIVRVDGVTLQVGRY